MNTKEKIIKSALNLFIQNGTERTSMNMIAAEAGVSKPAIYYYFKNKVELAEGVVDYFSQTASEWAKKRFSGCKNIKEYLKTLFCAIAVFKDVVNILLDEIPQNARYNFNEIVLELSKTNPRLKQRFVDILLNSRTTFAMIIVRGQKNKEIRSDLDSDMLALQASAIIEGLNFLSSVDDSLDLEKIGKSMFEEFWKMIAVT